MQSEIFANLKMEWQKILAIPYLWTDLSSCVEESTDLLLFVPLLIWRISSAIELSE